MNSIVKLFSNKVTTGQMPESALGEDILRKFKRIHEKPTFVILNGPVGLGKSKIAGNKSTFTSYTHKSIHNDMTRDPIVGLRMLMWYDHLNFIKYIRFIDQINYEVASISSIPPPCEVDKNITILNNTIFDIFTYRTIVFCDGYTCEPNKFRSKIETIFNDPHIFSIIQTCRTNILSTLKHLKANFNYKILWILSKNPAENIANLRDRVFIPPANINWARYCVNQMYLFQRLAILLGIGKIIYVPYSITVKDIQEHLYNDIK